MPVNPAYLLILCDKSFALLDALDLVEAEDRAVRKAVIEELKRAEKLVEAWKDSLPPPLVLKREEPVPAAAPAPAARSSGGGAAPAKAPRRAGEPATSADDASLVTDFLCSRTSLLTVLVVIVAWAAFYVLNKKSPKL